jgi:steroid delta-isomerase-like uncharacterized protein
MSDANRPARSVFDLGVTVSGSSFAAIVGRARRLVWRGPQDRRARSAIASLRVGHDMQPIELVRQMCEDVYGKGRLELLPQLLADGFVQYDPIKGRIDRNGIEADVRTYRTAFPDMTMEVVDSFASGEKVMARWRATGTHKAALFGAQPTNKRVTIEGITEGKIVNGKIVEAWVQWDTVGLLRQLGVVSDQLIPRTDGGARSQAQQPRR